MSLECNDIRSFYLLARIAVGKRQLRFCLEQMEFVKKEAIVGSEDEKDFYENFIDAAHVHQDVAKIKEIVKTQKELKILEDKGKAEEQGQRGEEKTTNTTIPDLAIVVDDFTTTPKDLRSVTTDLVSHNRIYNIWLGIAVQCGQYFRKHYVEILM